MVFFIDESGIHRPSGYSSLVLVCAKDLATIDGAVSRAEAAAKTQYFHWAHRGWPVRRDFINALASADFSIRVARLHNPISLGEDLASILPYLIPERHAERIYIDGSKPKHYLKGLNKVLRDQGLSVKKIRAVNDKSFPGIRAADAIAGLIRYSWDKPGGRADELYRLMKPKIAFIHLQETESHLVRGGQHTE